MGKYYAVVDGHSKMSLILDSWDQCKKEVTGAKGVKFKSFVRKEDAQAFIEDHGGGSSSPGKDETMKTLPKNENQVIESPSEKLEGYPGIIEIYVDGSYEIASHRYAFGLVVVKNGVEIHASCGAYQDDFSSLRNVAGEVLGAQKAMLYAVEHGYTHLNLYFDYQGIESWAKGSWKRNNALTQGYHDFYQEMKGKLQVTFLKVKGHSGDYFNDRADGMAKSAFLE